ncbi:unnamed protein product [Bursaphelenchus okinawaensis]|uniref:Presenilin n=1 Tax=Bursaphelenchus okinawaensis TaxID=465554 RepID=A0A811LGE4_9BILA|nr:unnamed protein product [Bursaphelenchus okinawaensis]CAG9121955.1 unnamed protein product [Bursaphelenchus okinawaensis]
MRTQPVDILHPSPTKPNHDQVWDHFAAYWSHQLKQVVDLIWPVMINMFLTLIGWCYVYGMKSDQNEMMSLFQDSGSVFYDGVINGVMCLGSVAGLSFVMVVLAIYQMKKFIQFWLTASCLLITFGVSFSFFHVAAQKFLENHATLAAVIVTLVYGLFGVLAFFTTKLKIGVHQFYVVCNCSLVSMFYLRVLPGSTAWFLLSSIIIWDMFAVLTPLGPLKQITGFAHDYGEDILRFLMFSTGEEETKQEEKRLVKSKMKNESGQKVYRTLENEDFGQEMTETVEIREKTVEIKEKDGQKVSRTFEFEEYYGQKVYRKHVKALEEVSESSEASEERYEERMAAGLDIRRVQDEEEIDQNGELDDNFDNTEDSDDNFNEDGGNGDHLESESEESFDENDVEEIEEEEVEQKEVKVIGKTALDALNDSSARLGMGDFVFYSLLIGQAASSGSIMGTIAPMIGIVIGLVVTLTLLTDGDETTPALPVSVFFGIVLHFGTVYLVEPFLNQILMI